MCDVVGDKDENPWNTKAQVIIKISCVKWHEKE